jgi:HKD family nuclease
LPQSTTTAPGSNLSHSAILTGIEWNYRAVSKADGAGR